MPLTPDMRRFRFCLLVSAFANLLLLPLAGHFWRSMPLPAPASRARIKLVTLALPRPAPIIPVPLPVNPASRPILHFSRRRPPPVRKHVRPGARVHSTQPAPLARPSGGREAGAPAPPPSAPAPISLPRPYVIAAKTPAPRLVRNDPLPQPSLNPAASDTPPNSPAPIVPAVSAAATGHGAGGTAAGKDAGGEAGKGQGTATGSGASRDAGEPFGVGAGLAGDGGPRHVVYVLDISGSMESRIDRAEEELRHALGGLGPGETFNIVAFSDRVQPFDTGMAPATPDLERRAEYFLTTLQVSGGTNLEAALARALALPDVNEVVLLTDGVPTLGETDFGKLARLIRRLNSSHARISTIGLVGKNPDGTDDSFEAATLLRQIARDSGGASKLVSLGVASP